MSNKKINTILKEENLFTNKEFKDLLKFEAGFAGAVKGGHLPFYFFETKKQRLVSSVNIFTSQENQALVLNTFIGKN